MVCRNGVDWTAERRKGSKLVIKLRKGADKRRGCKIFTENAN